MADSQAKHRPGPMKQTNKTHKHGRHRSKGKMDEINSGILAVFRIDTIIVLTVAIDSSSVYH